jgi:hypothetical protein
VCITFGVLNLEFLLPNTNFYFIVTNYKLKDRSTKNEYQEMLLRTLLFHALTSISLARLLLDYITVQFLYFLMSKTEKDGKKKEIKNSRKQPATPFFNKKRSKKAIKTTIIPLQSIYRDCGHCNNPISPPNFYVPLSRLLLSDLLHAFSDLAYDPFHTKTSSA